ncbi:MAG: SH3 domain-containing protein [Rhodospirillaceae bacterium]|nr:SH3 domain-containing protein [Rhodospirillaceae bacterium]
MSACRKSIGVVLLALAALAWAGGGGAAAQSQSETGLPVPRFVTLRANEVNLRTGPGEQYPIDWIYVRAGLPVEVIGEFGNWRRIRDFEGIEGWVFHSLLSGQRNVMVQGEDIQPLQEEPADTARTVALVQPGVLGGLERCPPADASDGGWCFVDLEGRRGWLPRESLYGVYPFEEVE